MELLQGCNEHACTQLWCHEWEMPSLKGWNWALGPNTDGGYGTEHSGTEKPAVPFDGSQFQDFSPFAQIKSPPLCTTLCWRGPLWSFAIFRRLMSRRYVGLSGKRVALLHVPSDSASEKLGRLLEEAFVFCSVRNCRWTLKPSWILLPIGNVQCRASLHFWKLKFRETAERSAFRPLSQLPFTGAGCIAT